MNHNRIIGNLTSSANLKLLIADDFELVNEISNSLELIIKTVKNKGTIYLCGNGGSACDAMHFCEELVARYKMERPGIKAQHFMDPSTMTCWTNDYDFDTVFSRQVETFCSPNDVLIVFSTSGNSKNIIKAVEAAVKVKCPVIGFTGYGGKLRDYPINLLKVPNDSVARIQEVHITIVHIFCELIEQSLFAKTERIIEE